MPIKKNLGVLASILVATSLSCQIFTFGPAPQATPTETQSQQVTQTPLPPRPVEPGAANPNEPVFISGLVEYTSPFFINSAAEPFILLEDQAGFVARDRDFLFALQGQSIGPVELIEDGKLKYSLPLPAIPQGTFLDVDQNGEKNLGVQIFAVAYWSNTWGGPFLEERDGHGWSTGYASTITDPKQDDEIVGGILVIWAPDNEQSFPTGFGVDGKLFTNDDPVAPLPAGYNLVDLNQEPFRFYKEAEPVVPLYEGDIAVNDYSSLTYPGAFDALFEKASREYPFTVDKGLDWQSIYDEFSPRMRSARNNQDFYQAIHAFTLAIPDGHVGVTLEPEVFFRRNGGGFGIVLAELSDGRVIASQVLEDLPAENANIRVGAEIVTWDGRPILETLDVIEPFFGPYSSQAARRQGQLVFLPRVPPGTRVALSYLNPGDSRPSEIQLDSTPEYNSLLAAIPGFNQDELALPVEAQVMDDSGLGLIRITTFSDDYNLMARLWERHIQALIDNDIPGLILDLRINGGGSSGLASDFAGYFYDDEQELYRRSYFNENTGQFEYLPSPFKVKPGPLNYAGKIAVLVSADCVSACEGFAYVLSLLDNVILVGHTSTAGAFGEVGRGQYKLPGDLNMQFPTGRSETLDGGLLIEGVGVVPDHIVPVTLESATGQVDAVLSFAVETLLLQIR